MPGRAVRDLLQENRAVRSCGWDSGGTQISASDQEMSKIIMFKNIYLILNIEMKVL